MASYPTLEDMGVKNPDEIAGYNLHLSGNTDVLRIIYHRRKGSLLPESRKYRFGRAEKMVVADSGTSRTERVFEISPVLQKALLELDSIIAKKGDAGKTREQLLEEIARLEEDVAASLAQMRKLTEQL